MAIWNVRMSVVELVDAPTAERAIRKLQRRLDAAGFETYDGDEPDAFESEPVPPEWVMK